MDGVGLLPVAVGKERDHAERRADHVVGLARGEERAVAAVVLDDEEPDEEARHRQGEQQRPAVVPAPEHRLRHEGPEQHERHRGVHQLPGGAAPQRPRIGRAELAQRSLDCRFLGQRGTPPELPGQYTSRPGCPDPHSRAGLVTNLCRHLAARGSARTSRRGNNNSAGQAANSRAGANDCPAG